MTDSPVVVWGLAPVFGLPSPSPFCLKLETWLRMAGVDYEARALKGPPKSETKKAPYLERADGSLLADSSIIIRTLADERSIDPWQGVDGAERARGIAITRLVEESLYFALLHERWIPRGNRAIARDAYFGAVPGMLRKTITNQIAKSVEKSCHGQGFGRLSAAEQRRKAIADLDALELLIGDDDHVLGPATPVDASVYGAAALWLWSPLDSKIQEHAKTLSNLKRFAEGMRDRYWVGSSA